MTPSCKRIRVSLFLRRPRAGETYSVERFFDAVVRALPEDRFDVRWLVCPFHSKGVIRRLALVMWAAIHQGDVNHIAGDVNFLGLLMRRSRTMLTILDSATMQRLSGWRRWLYHLFWLRLPMWHAALVVAISAKTLRETAQHVPAHASKLIVIPCCVPRGLRRRAREFDQASPRLLVVGTKPNKNLPRIIQAVAGLPCTLVVVGRMTPEHLKDAERNRVRVENHVELDDAMLALQYENADALIFVSTYEGFGMPILEAQQIGRPVVASGRSPMKEVAGAGACLVDPESVEEIAGAIRRVVGDSDYRAALVRAGFENVECYSADAVARRYAAVYEKIVSR